jgi:toxin-antitoxin system PIN domain toxin
MNLLDVNLLVALCDADHIHHRPAARWFRAHRAEGWATCPLTENGLLRVMGHRQYPAGPGSPDAVRPLLQSLRSIPGHIFWEDNISIADSRAIPSLRGVASKQLTDLYLLALCVAKGSSFATLDSRIDPSPVPRGNQSLVIISAEADL